MKNKKCFPKADCCVAGPDELRSIFVGFSLQGSDTPSGKCVIEHAISFQAGVIRHDTGLLVSLGRCSYDVLQSLDDCT